MAAPSRLERLKASIGAENMPPKLPQQTPQCDTNKAATSHLPALQSYLAETFATAKPFTSPTPKITISTAPNPHPPRSSKMASSSDNDDSEISLDPRCGETAPPGLCFVPLRAVSRFCYTSISKAHSQEVATALFDADKIWQRPWDLYFVWNNRTPTSGPMIFVSETQFQLLLADINEKVPRAQVFGTGKWDSEKGGIVFDFSTDAECLRPRFLGRSTCKEQYENWSRGLPTKFETPETEVQGKATEIYEEKLIAVHQINKNKKSGGGRSGRSGGRAAVSQNDMANGLVRAQRILGLAASVDGALEDSLNRLTLTPFALENPVPFAFDNDAMIIAFDVEAHEHNARAITEVGIATLDTRDLVGLAPGEAGRGWHSKIRARHFRVEEYRHHVNKDFVSGCPDRFEFGTSEFVRAADLPMVLTSCFHHPFSGTDQSPITEVNDKRNLVLLGHDINADVHYLRSIGFDPLNRGNIRAILDTVQLFRTSTNDPNNRALGSILGSFDLANWNLHNGGNDAVYTQMALLAICVSQTAKERGVAPKTESTETETEADADTGGVSLID